MRKSNKIYMDYAASVKPNPGSVHLLGENAKRKLEGARAKVCGILNARPGEIIFTSGGTESNNIAIEGAVWAWLLSGARTKKNKKTVPHIITTNIEHPSVLETCKMLKKRGLAEISVVPVEGSGIVDAKKIKKKIKENTILVSVMYANNEIGTIQPVREIARELRLYKKTRLSSYPLFHTDAVQAVNYLDLNAEKIGADLISLSGSKIENAGRVGVLYKRKSAPVVSVFGGGDQEGGLRPGTENLDGIIKFALALESSHKIKEEEGIRLAKLRDYFFEKLLKLKNKNMTLSQYPSFNILVNGDMRDRLPNNVNITVQNIPSDLLVIELSSKGVMASSKSACKSAEKGGSYVIDAIRPDQSPEIGGVRFSLGRETTRGDIDYTVKALSQILNKLEKWYN